MWEINNEARVSKKAEWKGKFSRNQNDSTRHPPKLSNILVTTNEVFMIFFVGRNFIR